MKGRAFASHALYALVYIHDVHINGKIDTNSKIIHCIHCSAASVVKLLYSPRLALLSLTIKLLTLHDSICPRIMICAPQIVPSFPYLFVFQFPAWSLLLFRSRSPRLCPLGCLRYTLRRFLYAIFVRPVVFVSLRGSLQPVAGDLDLFGAPRLLLRVCCISDRCALIRVLAMC